MGGRKQEIRLGGGSGEGVSALMYACQQGNNFEVQNILSKKPSSVTDRDRSGKTALHYCAENTNLNCVDLLLGQHPKLIDIADENGFTPLHLAVISGNKVLVRSFLSRGANLHCLDAERHSVVHWATVCGESECLSMLIDAGANPSTTDIHGASPIHYASQMCGPSSELGSRVGLSILKKLLAHGVNVNVTDQGGRQPLLWAASAGSRDAILALVNAGANVHSQDKDGLRALHCAASRGHNDCLETLFKLCGAELDALDSNGCTALFYAITLGHADCTQLLLKYGAQPNRQDRTGRTPAHCGADKGQLETLKIFSKYGGNLWTEDSRGDLPLHKAIYSGRKDLVLWLLEQRPDEVNTANKDGITPLHIAAKNNNVEMCKVLLDNKANVNSVGRNRKGQLVTPFDEALSRSRGSCAKYLQLSHGLPASKLAERLNRPPDDDRIDINDNDPLPIPNARYTDNIARFLENPIDPSPHDDKANQVDMNKDLGKDKGVQTFVELSQQYQQQQNLIPVLDEGGMLHHGPNTPKTLYLKNHDNLRKSHHPQLDAESDSPVSGTGTTTTQKDSGISDRGHFSDFDSEEVPSELALTSSESNTLDRRKSRSSWLARKGMTRDPNKRRTWSEDQEGIGSGNLHEGETHISNSIHSNIKRYQRERKIFQALLELKRLQIKNGKGEEASVVRRLADKYSKEGLVVDSQAFQGPYTYRAFDNYLYDQLRLLSTSGNNRSPVGKSGKLKSVMLNDDDNHISDPTKCTSRTFQCHHQAHVYTGIPCAAFIRPKWRDNNFLPRISPVGKDGQSFSIKDLDPKDAVTLEIKQGKQKKAFSLPTDSLDKNKRYQVTFSVGLHPSTVFWKGEKLKSFA